MHLFTLIRSYEVAALCFALIRSMCVHMCVCMLVRALTHSCVPHRGQRTNLLSSWESPVSTSPVNYALLFCGTILIPSPCDTVIM